MTVSRRERPIGFFRWGVRVQSFLNPERATSCRPSADQSAVTVIGPLTIVPTSVTKPALPPVSG